MVLLIVFFTFRNPVSDLWYLNNPKTIQLENAYMTVNRGGKRNFYHLCGNDKNGKQYSFDINKKDIVLKIICWKKLSKRLRLHIFRIQKSFLI